MEGPHRLEYLYTFSGRSPFYEWLAELRDVRTKARIQARINRLFEGNFGDFRSVGGGVFELRIDFGPGYRVYFGRTGPSTTVIISGGKKASQADDIKKAQTYWQRFKNAYQRLS